MCVCVCVCQGQRAALLAYKYKCLRARSMWQHLCFCFASPCLDSPLVALIRFVSIRLHSTGQLHTCKKVKPFQQKFTQLGSSPTPNEHSDWGRIRNLSNSYLKQEQGGTESMGCGDKLSSQPDDGCICMCLHLVVFDLHSRFKLRSARGKGCKGAATYPNQCQLLGQSACQQLHKSTGSSGRLKHLPCRLLSGLKADCPVSCICVCVCMFVCLRVWHPHSALALLIE